MPNDDRTPQSIWKFQEQEQRNMNVELTADKLCAMAQSREKFNARMHAAMFVFVIGLASMLLFNVLRLNHPWLRMGQAWTLGAVIYLFAPLLERGKDCIGADEPCVRFLERQHEERRLGYLRIRDRLFLFLPGIAASWWGRGAATWLFIVTLAALTMVWLAFGEAARKAARDREEVRRLVDQ